MFEERKNLLTSMAKASRRSGDRNEHRRRAKENPGLYRPHSRHVAGARIRRTSRHPHAREGTDGGTAPSKVHTMREWPGACVAGRRRMTRITTRRSSRARVDSTATIATPGVRKPRGDG